MNSIQAKPYDARPLYGEHVSTGVFPGFCLRVEWDVDAEHWHPGTRISIDYLNMRWWARVDSVEAVDICSTAYRVELIVEAPIL